MQMCDQLISLIRDAARKPQKKGRKKQMEKQSRVDDVIFHCYAPLTLHSEGRRSGGSGSVKRFCWPNPSSYAPLVLNLNYSLLDPDKQREISWNNSNNKMKCKMLPRCSSPAPCTVICSYRRHAPLPQLVLLPTWACLSYNFFFWGVRCLATLRRSRRTSNFVMNYDERAERQRVSHAPLLVAPFLY